MVNSRRFISSHGQHDKALLAAVGIIIAFGLIMLSSASSVIAYSKYHDSYYFFKHQLIWLMLGLAAFWFLARVDYHVWRRYSWLMLLGSIVLLLLVFIPGLRAEWGNARSWVNIFGLSLQPSEFVKVTFILYLAAWLEKRRSLSAELAKSLWPFLAILGLIGMLMLLQPDIGTLSIISLTSLVVYFIGGGKITHLAVILMISALIIGFMAYLKPYQANRFKCLLDPNYSKKEFCYQINQSLIAVGSGGLLGRGLGASRQKFLYVPETQGDSIFPIIGEEVGFIFTSALIILYIFVFYQGYQIAMSAPDDFGRILAIGLVSWLVLQALINIGGMINIIPMTGVPLPFISYGGSAMIAALAAVGILMNISKQGR